MVVWEWGEEDMLERKSVLYKSGFEPGVLNVDVKITLLVGWILCGERGWGRQVEQKEYWGQREGKQLVQYWGSGWTVKWAVRHPTLAHIQYACVGL